MPAMFAPTIVVNNVAVAIKPNSFSFTEGFGERNVRVASSGGGQTSQLTTTDIETQKSTAKFTLYVTSENAALVRQWLANQDNNAIEATDVGGFTRTFQKAVVTNNPEQALGADGEVEVEWMSRPAV